MPEEGELRFIPTRTHGVIDYLMGALLVVAPYILGFADGTAAQWVPQVVGAALIGAALLTDYELGAVRVIPMPVHLGLDVAAGLLLAVSPWLFGFADRVWVPHVIFGLAEIGAGLMTRTVPGTAAGTPTTTGR
jgi:SPW repeat